VVLEEAEAPEWTPPLRDPLPGRLTLREDAGCKAIADGSVRLGGRGRFSNRNSTKSSYNSGTSWIAGDPRACGRSRRNGLFDSWLYTVAKLINLLSIAKPDNFSRWVSNSPNSYWRVKVRALTIDGKSRAWKRNKMRASKARSVAASCGKLTQSRDERWRDSTYFCFCKSRVRDDRWKASTYHCFCKRPGRVAKDGEKDSGREALRLVQ
jgi:hypothetical protein